MKTPISQGVDQINMDVIEENFSLVLQQHTI